jgi:hypothetical protein
MARATADAIGVSRQRSAPGIWVPVIIVSVSYSRHRQPETIYCIVTEAAQKKIGET